MTTDVRKSLNINALITTLMYCDTINTEFNLKLLTLGAHAQRGLQ